MNNMVKCASCGKEVVPEVFGGKSFCPECESEILPAVSAETMPADAVRTSAKPAAMPEESGAVIKDGMGIIENTRTKIGAVDTFSDNSVVNNTTTHTTTNNTTNISNITRIEDDTKKSIVCEISGKQILVTSSVQCPVCGKKVAEQYYDEVKLRCSACEKQAVTEYEKYFSELTVGVRVIDKELRVLLDGKAKDLKLASEQVKEIELKLRKSGAGKESRLSDIKQKDFDRTLQQFLMTKISLSACLNKVSAYAKVTDDDAVQCWYHLLWAVSSPEAYRQALEESTVDDYWQIYWNFAAAVRLNNTAEAVNAIDVAKEKFPDRINDITFAQILLELCQFLMTGDKEYLDDAEDDAKSLFALESSCLRLILDERLTVSILMVLGRIKEHPAKQNIQPVKPAVSVSQSAASSSSALSMPAQKGVVLGNAADTPVNSQVSFDVVSQKPEKKKKSLGIIVGAIAVAGIGAFFFLGGKTDKEQQEQASEPVAQIQQQKPQVASSESATPSKPAVTSTYQASTSTPSSAPARPKNMAEKSMAATAAPASSAPASDDYAKAVAAYNSGDFKTAHDLFKKAGTAGNADACYKLGQMLSTGKGSIGKNTLQAKVWLKKAAELGHTEAKSALNAL